MHFSYLFGIVLLFSSTAMAEQIWKKIDAIYDDCTPGECLKRSFEGNGRISFGNASFFSTVWKVDRDGNVKIFLVEAVDGRIGVLASLPLDELDTSRPAATGKVVGSEMNLVWHGLPVKGGGYYQYGDEYEGVYRVVERVDNSNEENRGVANSGSKSGWYYLNRRLQKCESASLSPAEAIKHFRMMYPSHSTTAEDFFGSDGELLRVKVESTDGWNSRVIFYYRFLSACEEERAKQFYVPDRYN